MYIPNDATQNYPFCILVVENSIKVPQVIKPTKKKTL